MTENIIPKDTFFTVSNPEYDFYGTRLLCKALVDIDLKALRDEYLNEHAEEQEDYHVDGDQVVPWLVNKQYAVKIGFVELHIDDLPPVDFYLWEG